MKIYKIITLNLLLFTFIGALPQLVQEKLNKIKIYIDSSQTEKMGYGNWNHYEDGEYLMIKTFTKEGDVIIDAGAHTGDWSSLVLEHTNNKCYLYSFEPVPHFFKKLTTSLNNRANCYNLALGKNVYETIMNYYYVESEGCSSLFDRKVLSSIPVQKIDISVISLDSFCAINNIEKIDFLKIDTEGCEWDVLQGANKLISDNKIKFIQFEYGGTYPDANITLRQVYDYLTSHGYAIFRIAPDGLIHIPEWRDHLENYHLSNYLGVLSKILKDH